MTSGWIPDRLGGDWVCQHLDLPDIRGRKARSTLVTTRAELGRTRETVVLYLHGYNDYFFHPHVAQFFEEQGIGFFALDLHGYGRSTLDEESRNNCWDLKEYGPDLGAATRYLTQERGYQNLIILGHSTGGLLACLWALSPQAATTLSGLILNSPWLDLTQPWFDRVIAAAALDAVGGYLPDYGIAGDGSPFSRQLHVSGGGNWDFDLELKRSRPSPVRMGWLRAIRQGQARVHRGLDLDIPVLVLASNRSGPHHLAPIDSDTVLDVNQIMDRSQLLGSRVTAQQIPQGIHDLALGNTASRTAYFGAITKWLKDYSFSRT